jgi:xylulokinase
MPTEFFCVPFLSDLKAKDAQLRRINMHATSYILSYDFGTSGVKAVLADLCGNVIAATASNYRLYTPQPGWGEQDTEEYWAAVCQATKQALQNGNAHPSSVCGLVFGTMWKSVIPVDKNGHVLHRSVIWLDGRAGREARELNAALGTNTYCDKDYIPRLMWFKNNAPKIYEKTDCFLEANSWLKFRATGEKGVDLSNCYTSSPNPSLQSEYTRILGAAGLDQNKFAKLVMPWEQTGVLTAKAAGELGLAPGTPVFGGLGDIPAIAIGSGCSGIGDAHLYLGSSGWLGVVVPDQMANVGELYQSLSPGKEIMLYVVQATCMALNWAIQQFYRKEKEALGSDIFDLINEEIGQIEPGCGNMLATPWFYGERPPLSQQARALFFNITSLHDRRHMVRALLEGIGYTMRWKIDTYRQETGTTLQSIRIVGGGTGGENWMQAMADILGIPVEIPCHARHAGALGTAYCAYIGLGICRDFDDAKQMIRVEKRYEPDMANAQTYGRLYAAFRQLYPQLKDVYKTLNA